MSHTENSGDWSALMDAVHQLIDEAGEVCSEINDEPLCYSIASGLWLDGWKQAAPPAAVDAVVAAARAVVEQWESADWDRGDITDLHNQDVLLDKLSAAVREMGEQQ